VGADRKVLLVRQDQFGEVPDKPGVYAWYIDVRAMKPERAKSKPHLLSKDLQRKHGFIDPSTKVFLKSSEHFGAFWSAQIRISSRFTRTPLNVLDNSSIGDDLEIAWTAEDGETEVPENFELDGSQAEVLAQFLIESFPYFSSPIYIGTSKHLKTRLEQHRKAFSDLAEVEHLYSEDLEAGESWQQFASRCFIHGIKIDDLIVAYFELGKSEASPFSEPFKRARLAGERFLNLISRPLFGMR
jgi:hypothetical protein